MLEVTTRPPLTCIDCGLVLPPGRNYYCLSCQPAPTPRPVRRTPYVDPRGWLVIPFAADSRYHWWAGGQTILETLDEIGARRVIKARYRNLPCPGKTFKRVEQA